MGAHPSIKTMEVLGYTETYSKTYYRTAESAVFSEEDYTYGYSGDVIAADGDRMEAGSDFDYKRSYADINIESLGKSIAYEAYSMLGAQSIPSRAYQVVFKNKAFAQFWSVFADLFSADRVQNGKSVLADKMGNPSLSNG